MADASGSSKKPKKKGVGKKKVDEESAKSKNLKKKQTKKKGASRASSIEDLEEEKKDDDEGPTIAEMMAPMVAAKNEIIDMLRFGAFAGYRSDKVNFVDNDTPEPKGRLDADEELTEWLNFWFQTTSPGYSSFNTCLELQFAEENLSFYNLVLVLEGYASDLEDSVDSGRYLTMYHAFYRIWQKCFAICIDVTSLGCINIGHALRSEIAAMNARIVEASEEVYEWAQIEADGVRERSGGTDTREHTRERSGAKGSHNPKKARKKSK